MSTEQSTGLPTRHADVVADGSTAQPDLIVRGSSEDLANIFWGDENPASNYM